jgi:selenocysteine lyase/cysteine desulfurase
MNLNRRNFVRTLGVGTLGALAAPSLLAASRKPPAQPAPVTLPGYGAKTETAYWRAVRALYPLQDTPAYLNTGGLGPASQPVLDTVFSTMTELQQHSETGHELFEPARETLARYLGAAPAEICFTRNATEATSIIAAGIALREGDEVIFESHAHPGGSFPWFNQEKLRGIKARVFDPDPASPAANLARIRELITPRTRVIQVSHITCTTGLLFPVKAIAELAHAHGAWFHIDGAQSAGMIPVDVHAIGCDSYAVSGHKWIGGPHESGVLYLRRDRLDDIAVTLVGAHSGELDHLPGVLKFEPAATRHEYGTRNAGLACGLAAAVGLQEQIGRERIAAYGHGMATRLLRELAPVPGIAVLTPRPDEMRGSMIAIAHARADAGKLFGYLVEQHRLRCRPVTEQGLQAVRISTHVFNSHAECDRVIAAVQASARAL